MLNKFTNAKTWMAVSFLAAASIFGQSDDIAGNSCAPKQPCPPKTCPPPAPCPPKSCCPERAESKLNCAYNAPARIEVDSCGGWDFYFGASFIYWEAMQDNMDFAATVTSQRPQNLFAWGTPGNSTSAEVIGHDFEYKPGFKVILGMNFDRDHWDGYTEYTQFFSTTNASVSFESDTATNYVGITPVRGNGYFLLSQTLSSTPIFDFASQEWKLKFQSLDTALARTYYVGTKLTFRTIMGARFAWFTQMAEQVFASHGILHAEAAAIDNYIMKQNFASWGAGLLAGLNTNWLLGSGFSMVGNGSFDILYTRVQASNTKFSWDVPISLPQTLKIPSDRPDFLMPHVNLEFGFAWGSYFDCYNWHIDFAATYGFQVFWGANLFRNFDANIAVFNQEPNGNLYIHGANVSARLDF